MVQHEFGILCLYSQYPEKQEKGATLQVTEIISFKISLLDIKD